MRVMSKRNYYITRNTEQSHSSKLIVCVGAHSIRVISSRFCVVYFVSLSQEMEWSNEMVLTFLDYYEKEPVIWNASHPSHKKRHKVYNAWKRIEEKMGGEASVAQLKRKKDSLMASFRIITKRIKSGRTGVEKPMWFAYEKMTKFFSPKDELNSTVKLEVSNINIKNKLIKETCCDFC